MAGEACAQRRCHDARRRDRAERRQRSAIRRHHLDARPARVPRARVHPGQGRRASLSAGQGARLRRRRQRRLQRSQEPGGLARRASDHGGAVQAVARQGRRDAPGGPDRGREPAHRDRSRRGRGQRLLCLAGRRPAGAARWRCFARPSSISTACSASARPRCPAWGWSGRARSRWRWKSAAPRLPASTRATSPRASSSTPADSRSSGCRSATSAIPAFVATGRIQTQSSPGGSITVNLDARDLSGIQALSEQFAPALAGPLRRLAARQKTATLQASVSMESSGADGASGKIGLTGKVGAIRVNVSASATGKREAFMVTDLSALAGADVRIDGRFEADGSGPLLGLLGLDRVAAADSKPARLDVSANGPLGRELRLRRQARRRPDRCRRQGRACGLLPISRRRSISISSRARSAATRCRAAGRCASAMCSRIDGSIEAESLDAPAVIAAAIGMPSRSGAGGAGWSHRSDRLERNRSERPHRLQGAARGVRALARGAGLAAAWRGSTAPEVVFEDIAGELGKGRLDGRLAVANGAAGLTARLRVGLADAELGAIFPSTDRPATSAA